MFTLPVRADDILILASDGLSDNLWDEEVLDEVVRFRRTFLASSANVSSQLSRRTLAGMLSEALCSRARTVSQRRFKTTSTAEPTITLSESDIDDEIPFARRAREEGRPFSGGKPDGESPLFVRQRGLCSCVINPRYLGLSCGDFSRRWHATIGLFPWTSQLLAVSISLTASPLFVLAPAST